MANQTEKKSTILNNLRSIYKVQSSGTLQVFLRELRASKSQLEDELRIIQETKKSRVNTPLDSVKEQPNKEKDKPAVSVVEEKEQPATKEVKPVTQRPTFDKNQNNNYQNNNYQKRNFENRDFRNNNRPNNMQRPFNNNFNGNGQQRPFGNRNQNFNGQRPFNQNGQRSFNNNGQQRPFGQNGQRPFGRNNNFVSSKQNAFKIFEPTESSAVLSQPERNYGNKNKSNRQIEEKKQINKKSLLRKNIIVDDMSEIDEEGIRMGNRKLAKKKKEQVVFVAPKVDNATITTENITVKNLSEKIGRPVTEIIKQLMILGVMANINSTIDYMTAELVCGELGVKLEQKLEKSYEEQMLEDVKIQDNEDDMEKRPPVVAVMGHVDHGKTSLLDAIRKTNVVSGEAGGITQKIGAYQITWNNEKITFIDTPGHAAFTAMRARGAKVTDIAVLVVAADDGIMPQTIEAISHIKAANVPMIVAINKIDKPEANIERVKQQLAENGVLPEEWGGDAILVPVSAKKGIGLDELLKMILLVAEVQDLKANPKQSAVGAVIEAELDKNKGPIATVLVQSGTLHVGDSIISGVSYGKVRAMYDENGKQVKTALPSTPVAVLGLDSVPNSGDKVFAVDEKLSKQVIQERISKAKEIRANSTSGVSLEDFMDKVNEGKLKALNIIIKADVQGSVEALKQSLTAIKNEEAKVVCIHSGAGAVTESDLLLAQASNAVVINFNLKLSSKIEQIAESMNVQVKSYKVIYEVVDEITKAINGMLTVKYENQTIGHAEVRAMFKLSQSGVVCGSYVTDGKITRNAFVNVYRGKEKILETQIEALRIQKDDKAEINYGYECGIKLKDSTGVQVGDVFEVYQKVEIKRG